MSTINYQYDVFLSYAHIDNSPILQSKMGWVSELDNVLEKCIAMKRGKRANVWRDRELRGDACFDDSIAEAIRASRVFILVLSPSCIQQVFLAAAAKDRVEAHTKISSELSDRGLRVLPEGPLPIDYEDFVAQAREALSKARLSIHIVGDRYGFVPDGGDGAASVVELHNRLAAEQCGSTQLQRLIWWPEGEESNRVESQAAFLRALQNDLSLQQGAEIVYGSVEDLKTAIFDKIEDIEQKDRIQAQRERENAAFRTQAHTGKKEFDQGSSHDGPTWVYLLHGPGDDGGEDVSNLEDALFEQNFEVRTPLYDPEAHESERREANEENLRDCNACLIYYGSANERWVQKQLSDVRRSKLGRVIPTPLRSAVYLAPPFESQKKRFRTRMAQIVLADTRGHVATDFLNETQRNETQRNETKRNETQRNATQRNATQRNATRAIMNAFVESSAKDQETIQETGDENPFPGLRPFNAGEYDLFFGREEHIDALLDKLAAQRLTAVVGTSGTGKSSLVLAGILPRLDGGFPTALGHKWRIVYMRPGSDPIRRLASSLYEAARMDMDTISEEHDKSANVDDEQQPQDAQEWDQYRSESEIMCDASSTRVTRQVNELAPQWDPNRQLECRILQTVLRRSSMGLSQAAHSLNLAPKENLLILVDQFEALFRFSKLLRNGERDDASSFIRLLLESVSQANLPIYVMITMRSDFLGECSQFRGLAESINTGLFLVPALSRRQRQRSIDGPLAVVGARFGPALKQALMSDSSRRGDNLPILQHTLSRTYSAWLKRGQPDSPLELEDYNCIGGFESALGRHADEAFDSLNQEEQRVAEQLLRCLTDASSPGGGTRRPCKAYEVLGVASTDIQTLQNVVRALQEEGRNFIVVQPSRTALHEFSELDICHESLMREWPRLKSWMENELLDAKRLKHWSELADPHQRNDTDLLGGIPLENALLWINTKRPTNAWAKRYNISLPKVADYINDSRNLYETLIAKKQLRKRRRRVLRQTIVLGCILIGIAAIWNRDRNILEEDQRLKSKLMLYESDNTESESKEDKDIQEMLKHMAGEGS